MSPALDSVQDGAPPVSPARWLDLTGVQHLDEVSRLCSLLVVEFMDPAAAGQVNGKTRLPWPPLAEGEVRVSKERLPSLLAALQKLKQRAARLGIPEPRVETIRTESLPVITTFTRGWAHHWTYTGAVETFAILVAPSTPVRLDGWRFAAVIEHLPATEGVEAMNLVRASPAFPLPLPVSYRTDPPTCDHCKQNRRRAETFVLHQDPSGTHPDGRWARVGRNCLTDYVGDASASQLVHAAAVETALADLIADAGCDGGDGDGGGGSRRARAVSPVYFLAATAVAMESIGWVSRTVARQTEQRSTSEWAWIRFDPPRKPAEDARVLGVQARDNSFGLQTIVRLQAAGRDGTCVHDLVWFATGEVRVTTDEVAVAAWTAAQNRHAHAQDHWLHIDGLARRARYDRDMDPGDRALLVQDASAALDELKAAESGLVSTREPASNAVRGICPGDLVELAGTVKRHDVSARTERVETVVTRCVLRWIPEFAP